MDAHTRICRAIDNYREQAIAVSHAIHGNPEPRFEERFAARLLSAAARELGLNVELGVGGLETAFRTEFGDGGGPSVAIFAEYDALPNGHSCGHNLIAGAALCAAAGLKRGLEHIAGKIVFMGTPAEEGGGGKIILLQRGALAGVDAALMAHPLDGEVCTMPALASTHLRFVFGGKAAHAAIAPWDGASALSAMLQTFQSTDAARLHFRDGARLHGIILEGGRAVNIIPDRAVCEFLARGRTSQYADELAARVIRCAEAAALATGATLESKVLGAYKNMINNRAIAHHYAHLTEELGAHSPEAGENVATGSTDMGDISHVMPAIHPLFQIAPHGAGTCHEDAFVKHADSEAGYAAMVRVGKALAMTAYDLLTEPGLLAAAKAEFAQAQKS